MECRPIDVPGTRNERVGNISVGIVSLNDKSKFHLAVIYIHPEMAKTRIQQFMLGSLAQFVPSADVDIEMPLLVTGDFNVNIDDDKWLVELFENDFGLTYVPSYSHYTWKHNYRLNIHQKS